MLIKDLAQMAVDKLRTSSTEADLAACLGTLGNGCSDLGERDEAREAYSEALEIYWPLVNHLPKAYGHYFMVVLENYLQIVGEAPDDNWYQLWQQLQAETETD